MISHKVLIPYSIVLGLFVLISVSTTTYWTDMLKLHPVAEASVSESVTQNTPTQDDQENIPATPTPAFAPQPTTAYLFTPEVAGIAVTAAPEQPMPTVTPQQTIPQLFLTPSPTAAPTLNPTPVLLPDLIETDPEVLPEVTLSPEILLPILDVEANLRLGL